jgi:hypothetical protein
MLWGELSQGFIIKVDLYVASARLWDYLNPELSKFVKFPPPN